MNIKKLRKEKSLTQAELAERLGISRGHLNGIENGRLPLTKSLEIAIKATLNN